MIVGQVVRIKATFLGPKEDPAALYIVRTPDEPGKPRVDISAISLIDYPLWPMEVVTLEMIEATEFCVAMD